MEFLYPALRMKGYRKTAKDWRKGYVKCLFITHSFLPKESKYSELGIASVTGEIVLGKLNPLCAKPEQETSAIWYGLRPQ
ncbi:hypothetical protein ABT47_06055 [Shewanella xiamenensis]|nr:hypothetical protein ABT47_06055 [Shewanella xiamenensis]